MNKTMFVTEPASQNVVITRMFDEPPEVAFKIMTDPIQIPQWWGPRELTTEIDMFELREGGMWRFIQHNRDGKRFGFHGVYHEIEPVKRLVYTFEYEGMPGHPSLIIDTFENIEGMTRFTELTVFPSIEERDGMIQGGMQVGIEESMERIDELLKECCGEMM